MGWRAGEAYDRAQREDFLAWRRSLTWGEMFRWEAERLWPVAVGAGGTALVCWFLFG
jgi:hypothetical protein